MPTVRLRRAAGGIVIKDFRGTSKVEVSILTNDLAAAVHGAELCVVPRGLF